MLRTPEPPMGRNNKENTLLEEQRDAEDAEPKVRSSSNTYFLFLYIPQFRDASNASSLNPLDWTMQPKAGI